MSKEFEQISIKPGFMKHNGGVLFRSISEIGCKYGVIFAYSRGTVPPPVNKKPPYKTILNNLTTRGLPKKIIGKFFEILLKKNPKFFGINYADYYVIGGGKLASHDCPIVGEDTSVQKIHAPDYDLFLEHKNQITKKQNDEFIVFIDQNFSYQLLKLIFVFFRLNKDSRQCKDK